MNKFLKILFVVLIGINLTLCAWYVIHKDLYFHTDIARDFLLLQEVDQKKIVLLGPRSSTSGLFHGPLWLYLNYPAYVIGQGNPIVVGWYWILLIGVFLVTSFVIARKLFNDATAYVFCLLLSQLLIFEARSLFNPHGAFFLLPAFFFFFIRSLQLLKPLYLLVFFLISGLIIQFQMAIGIPLLLLATAPIIYQLIKKKKKKYLVTFFILLLPLSTFIVFDLTHQFLQLHSVLAYVFNNNLDKHTYGNLWGLLGNRLIFITNTGIGLVKEAQLSTSILIGLIFIFFLVTQLKAHRFRLIYLSALYFYVGYYLLSLVNKSGGMLYHYSMPLYPLVFLIFASFITAKYKQLFVIILLFIYVSNIGAVKSYITASKVFFGQDQNSWLFLHTMAEKIYQGKEKELGYFIYMPDALAYQPKYAVSYAAQQSDKTVHYFQKKPITYLVIAPPPPDKPGMQDAWWKTNQAKITAEPKGTLAYPNGYKIEKYELTEAEQAVPFDPSIDTGIHFR